jgi:hypothetical protein
MTERDPQYLAIYLNDHLAGSTTGIELARRAARQYDGTELGEFFAELEDEIEADRDTLKALMEANGVEQDRVKLVAAWVAEKAGRFKFNGALLRRSPLTPFVELETLEMGIHGKLLLWRALRVEPADDATAAQLDELIARAEHQLEAVERRRIETGREVLSSPRAPVAG